MSWHFKRKRGVSYISVISVIVEIYDVSNQISKTLLFLLKDASNYESNLISFTSGIKKPSN